MTDLHAKVKSAGWNIVFSSSFVRLLLPAMSLSRLLSGNYYKKEMAMHPWMNCLMGKVMDVEFLLTKLGLQFPWGGSRILVAKK